MLRKDTFHEAKRFILLGIMLLSVGLPFVHIAHLIPQKESIQYIVLLVNDTMTSVVTPKPIGLTTSQWINLFLLSGMAITLLVLIFRYALLFKEIRSSKKITIDGQTIYVPEKEVNPFSFRGRIYLNPYNYSSEEIKKITDHENAHISQHHDIDLILTGFFRIVAWMNPLYLLYLNAVMENIEFLADKAVLKAGNDPQEYQYILLKVAQVPALPMTHNFNFAHLKKRVVMMNKKRTHTLWSGKYFLLIPVLFGALLLVNATELRDAWLNADFTRVLNIANDPDGDNKKIKTHFIVVQTNKDSTESTTTSIYMDGKPIKATELDTIIGSKIKIIKIQTDSSLIFNGLENFKPEFNLAHLPHLNDTILLIHNYFFKDNKINILNPLDISVSELERDNKLSGINLNLSEQERKRIINEWKGKTGNGSMEQLGKTKSLNGRIKDIKIIDNREGQLQEVTSLLSNGLHLDLKDLEKLQNQLRQSLLSVQLNDSDFRKLVFKQKQLISLPYKKEDVIVISYKSKLKQSH
jgi:hypothetical protein